jgi:hypothetical protein
MTHVPATLREAQTALARADPQTVTPLTEGYRWHILSRSTVASPNAGCSSTLSTATYRRSVRLTGSCASKGRRKQKPSRSCAARPLPVKRMRSRRWRPLREGCRPPSCTSLLCDLHHATASGDGPEHLPGSGHPHHGGGIIKLTYPDAIRRHSSGGG